MPNRTIPPHIHTFTNYTLAVPQSYRTVHGIPCKVFVDNNLNLIHFIIRIQGGTLFEKQKKIAATTYQLLKESHPLMNENETDAFMDFYGSTFNISVGMTFISIELVIPQKNCLIVLPEILEILANPTFKEENLVRFKEKSIKNLEYNSMKTDFRNTQLMFHSMLGDGFACGKILEPSDYDKITIEQLHAYYKETFCAENLRLYLAGNLPDDLIQQILKSFERIPAGKACPPLKPLFVHFQPQRIEEHWPHAQQTSLSLCKPLFSCKHPDALPFYFLNTLLCNYFGSRLMKNLREKNSYTYGISGNNYNMGDSSLFCIESDINNENVEKAIAACFTEMQKIREENISDEEMEIVRNYLYGENLRSVDGTIAYEKKYMQWEDFGMDMQRYYHTMETIRNIQASTIKDLANNYLQSDGFTIITVGK